MVIIHNLTNKFTATHIVEHYIVATHKPILRRFNKFITTATHIIVKTVYTKLVKMRYPDKIRKIRKRSGYKTNRFCPVFKFDISYFVPILYLSENTKTSG